MAKENSLEKKIINILIKYDPMDFLEYDSPKDEYESEMAKIKKKLISVDSVDEFQKAVHNIFVDAFGKDIAGIKERYDGMSEEIYSLFYKS